MDAIENRGIRFCAASFPPRIHQIGIQSLTILTVTTGVACLPRRVSSCCFGLSSRINDSKALQNSQFSKAVRFNLRADRLKVNVYRLERFHNSGALSDGLQGGFYFHPTDEDLSVGTPVGEDATWRLRTCV